MIVADSSCILAIAFGEPGMEVAAHKAQGALVSTVSVTECVAKLRDRGWEAAATTGFFDAIGLTLAEHTREVAVEAGLLHSRLRRKGVSMGDCCCLALALSVGAKIATADRQWAELGLDLEVELIR